MLKEEETYKIGQTRYKRVNFSPVESAIYILNEKDVTFRLVETFQGKDASVNAHRTILDRINN